MGMGMESMSGTGTATVVIVCVDPLIAWRRAEEAETGIAEDSAEEW